MQIDLFVDNDPFAPLLVDPCVRNGCRGLPRARSGVYKHVGPLAVFLCFSLMAPNATGKAELYM